MKTNAANQAPPRSAWPYAIIAWFIVFGSAMAVWIAVALRQNMDLVSADYYEHEIRYQQQIDRQARTQSLEAKARLTYDAGQQRLTIALPAGHASQARGKVALYRPSDARLDRESKLSVNSAGEQMLDTKGLRPGLWKVRVHWTFGGEEYFYDQAVTITPPA
ncbi:MAG: FixH family protein [Limisphaerales bacterium]